MKNMQTAFIYISHIIHDCFIGSELHDFFHRISVIIGKKNSALFKSNFFRTVTGNTISGKIGKYH